jgi:hypothetical protein
MQAQHRMRRTETWPSGAEEWWCPACGRRLLLGWPPSHHKLVLDAGDELAAHTGATPASLPSDEPDPGGFRRGWLHDNGIDWDGTAA